MTAPLLRYRVRVSHQRQALGMVGEELATQALAARGYAILDRRYRTGRGEIDIIAQDGEWLVFVEVRARATTEFGGAAESVTVEKQRKVSRMAAEYLAINRITGRACRFDVVTIDNALGKQPQITVFRNAFDASGVV